MQLSIAAPAFSSASNLTVAATSAAGAVVSYPTPTATDIVDGATLDVPVETEVVWGDPAMEIHRLAASIGADAIVITVKNRSRVGKLLLGSHAQQIILGAERPVICVPLN